MHSKKIEFGRAILVLLVILGHLIQKYDANYLENIYYVVIYNFHMPAFFVISGASLYIIANKTSKFFKYFCKLFAFVVVGIVLKIVFWSEPLPSIPQLFMGIHYYWFFHSLLFCSAIFLVLRRIIDIKILFFIMPIILFSYSIDSSVYPWLKTQVVYLFYIALGFYFTQIGFKPFDNLLCKLAGLLYFSLLITFFVYVDPVWYHSYGPVFGNIFRLFSVVAFFLLIFLLYDIFEFFAHLAPLCFNYFKSIVRFLAHYSGHIYIIHVLFLHLL